jgi:hypothetical protein
MSDTNALVGFDWVRPVLNIDQLDVDRIDNRLREVSGFRGEFTPGLLSAAKDLGSYVLRWSEIEKLLRCRPDITFNQKDVEELSAMLGERLGEQGKEPTDPTTFPLRFISRGKLNPYSYLQMAISPVANREVFAARTLMREVFGQPFPNAVWTGKRQRNVILAQSKNNHSDKVLVSTLHTILSEERGLLPERTWLGGGEPRLVNPYGES